MRKTLSTAYGLTETASVATVARRRRLLRASRLGRARRADRRAARRRRRRVATLPPGERGEIWIKGPTVMNRGYWHRPDANAAAFTDGWFHTGDIGYLDADGFLYLVDRAKDMIIRAGENVYCVEIENVLFDHPDVIDAAVVGVAAQDARRRGQGGRAAHGRARPRPPRTSARSAARTSPTSRCRSTSRSATEPLPRNPAGKVLKNVLRGGDSAFATADDQAL